MTGLEQIRKAIAVIDQRIASLEATKRRLAEEFGTAFRDADILIVNDIYPAGEKPIPGVSAGLIMNLGVIVLNGGRMPVRVGPGSFRWNDGQALTHVPMAHSAKLWFLGDLIRISFYGSHALFLSPGDLLVAYGVFVVVQNLMLTKHEQAKNHAVSGG